MKDNPRTFAGMDIGDRCSEICILDAQGEIVEQTRTASTEASLIKYFSPRIVDDRSDGDGFSFSVDEPHVERT